MKILDSLQVFADIRITSDVYAHISKKIELDNMDKFENYMESDTQKKQLAKTLNL